MVGEDIPLTHPLWTDPLPQPGEALAAYQAPRLAHPELHGRGGVRVFLPADSPAVVTTEAGREVLRVKAVGANTGRKPSRFSPTGQVRNGNAG